MIGCTFPQMKTLVFVLPLSILWTVDRGIVQALHRGISRPFSYRDRHLKQAYPELLKKEEERVACLIRDIKISRS